jgi:glutamate N-acetyltransferase/amino-acid N-acetyltransferase
MKSSPPVSPLAPEAFPDLPAVAGVRFATGACGVKYKDRTDVLLAELAPGTTVAGTLTKSKTAAAPVLWCRECLAEGEARGLLVNAGNANAFTGVKGLQAVEASVQAVADVLSCRPSRVFAASTGVIGEPLPYERIVSHLEGMAANLAPAETPEGWLAAASAIMTTDTFPKGAAKKVKIGDAEVAIAGFCKGSGMIAPDMATMLCFIFTDAKLPAGVLQAMLSPGVEKSFNAITVDSDTSTSDTVLLFATGAGAEHPEIASADDAAVQDFRRALNELLLDLAHQVVRDGEGATKFISVTITGAEDDGAAKRIGLAVANSPLVKTAIAGEDANWGRIVMAVGKAGEAADRDKISIVIGGVPVAETGMAVDGFDETPVAEHMKGQDIDIQVDVGVGSGRATVWTCDLTHGYIEINADYRS